MTHTGRVPRTPIRAVVSLAMIACSARALALDLVWPEGAQPVLATSAPVAGFAIATGPHDGAQVPVTTVAGDLAETVWQIPGDGGDPVALLAVLRAQLTAQGYDIGFACADRACGGFDFRHALPIPPGPAMYVDLGRFQYLTASRTTPQGTDHVVLTLSHGGATGYAHDARITPAGAPPAAGVSSGPQVATVPQPGPAPLQAAAPATPAPQLEAGVIARIEAAGSAVLEDVTFTAGASALAGTRFDSLVALAAYLAADPARRIVVVGHTDATGSLEANIAVSRARADAVRAHLVDVLGADPRQIAAEGVGYLSPRASNATPQGREANRRVEIVLPGG